MKKRRMFTAVIILVVLAIAGFGGWYGLQLYDETVADLHERVAQQEEEILLLNDDLDYYEDLILEAFCFNKAMKAGTRITAEDVEVRTSTVEATPYDVFSNKDDIVGKIVKIDCTAGTVVTQSNVMDEHISAHSRELDLVLDEVPIAIQPGDYVDIRISFPLGQDYIAMSHKKVIGVYENVLKVIIDQEDIYTYESMKTDASIYVATKLYAVKYVEPGVQAAAVTYYPVSREIMQTMILDKNIETSDFTDTLTARLELETVLNGSDKVEKKRTVTSDKSALIIEFKNAQIEYERMQALKNNK